MTQCEDETINTFSSGLHAMQAKNNLKTPPIVCYTNGFRLHNPALDKLKFTCSRVYFKLYPHKIAGCCPLLALDKYHLHLLIITFGVHKHTRARADQESVYNISTPLLFRLLARRWGGGCLMETSNCSVGSSLPMYLYTHSGDRNNTCVTRGPWYWFFLPAACQHQRDHEKIRNLRASMRDLGMIKRLTVLRCCYRDKLINPVRSMVLVPLN